MRQVPAPRFSSAQARVALADLGHGVGAVEGLQDLVVEIAHDAEGLAALEAREVAEDEFAGLVLAIGQV